jgi:acetyl esterase/lipase
MLQGRWTWRVPSAPQPRWERDVRFWTIPGTDRQLLCDVWQPAASIEPSGLAILYFHGSGWYLLDKDFGTRPFFRHLAGQGHLVVDVAYRLCPEVDVRGMVGDVKRAIAWITANAGRYGIDPARVVLGGASAGGHIALLGAFTPDHPDLRPVDVGDADLSVRAVFAYYSQTDMRAVFNQFAGVQQTSATIPTAAHVPPPPGKRGCEWLRYQAAQFERSANTLADLLGGSPAEVPQMYDLASPQHHAGAGCPPTLLVHGEHDMLVPVEPTRALHRKLLDGGVPVVYLELPQTGHAFDLLLQRTSPPAQAALYELERFLALMV